MVVVCPFLSSGTPSVPIHEKILLDFDKRAENVALEDGETEQKWTFSQVRQLAYSVAHALPQYGFKKGDIMGFYLENRAEFAPIFLGVSALGGALSGVNPLYTPEELGRQLVDCGAKFLFTRQTLLSNVLKAVPQSQLKVIFLYDGKRKSWDGQLVPMQDLFIFDNIHSFPMVHIDPKQDVLLIPYSSGTTGVPKGVMLTHENLNICFFTEEAATSPFRICQEGDSNLLVLPYFHMAGYLALVWGLKFGSKGVVIPRFDPSFYLKLAEQHRVSYLLMVPSIMVFLANHPDVQKYDLGSVKTVAVGAAPTGKELIQTLLRRLPNLESVTQVREISVERVSHGVQLVWPP